MIHCQNCQVCADPNVADCSADVHPHCDGCEHCFYQHVPPGVRMSWPDEATDATV